MSQNFTKLGLCSAMKKNFGTELDLKSNYIQNLLEKLKDPQYFNENKMFRLGWKEREKNAAWIHWWAQNGPDSLNKNENNKFIENNNNNSYRQDADEQKLHLNDNNYSSQQQPKQYNE
eukprot:96911_1